MEKEKITKDTFCEVFDCTYGELNNEDCGEVISVGVCPFDIDDLKKFLASIHKAMINMYDLDYRTTYVPYKEAWQNISRILHNMESSVGDLMNSMKHYD